MSMNAKNVENMTRESLDALPALPRDGDGPVFREPWEAEVFAMAVRLSEAGLFTWAEWADALSRKIAAAQAAGDPDLGDTYYRHWLAALETLAMEKTGLRPDDLMTRKEEWRAAYLATPHGQPVLLEAAQPDVRTTLKTPETRQTRLE